jgi:hypothetical protein
VRLVIVDPLRKFWRLSWQDRRLVVEAIIYLAAAAFGVAFLRFRYVAVLAARPTRQPQPSPQESLRKVRRIRWAVLATARRVPWRVLCFEQALAAQLMLKRRGIPSVLHYGAAQDRSGLLAHVWLRYGDVDVVGGASAHQFAILATFPPKNSEMTTGSL